MDSRKLAKETFEDTQIPNTPYNWHIWKRAFDLGYFAGKNNDDKHGNNNF